MIRISVNIGDEVDGYLEEVISSLTGPEASQLSERGGIAARNAAIEYHREFDQAGGWRGKRYLGPSQGDGSSFGADVARGWQLESATASGAVIANDADHYAFKVSGGTIRPKRAQALTIPMIPEARGLRASVYSQNTGNRLFTIRGKNALFERVETVTSGSRGRRGQAGASTIRGSRIRPVYALLKSVTQKPWPNAVPPDDVIQSSYTDGYLKGLTEILERP